MLPTQVVRLEAACGEWFHSLPRALWSVLGPHSWSADLCADGAIRGQVGFVLYVLQTSTSPEMKASIRKCL